MTEGPKPYPAYKPAGVPWLGDVPEHWGMRRTKTLLRERTEKGHPDEPLLAATQTKGVVRKEMYENRTVLALKDLHLLKLVRAGDFVISLRSFQGGIEYAREQGIISPAYTVLYASNKDAHGYLARLFKSRPYIENLFQFVTGIRQGQNIDYTKLGRSELPLPPSEDQSAIVRYLDHVDRRTRKYIRAKQKLIGLLNEQKHAIIHKAVTRGLDPNVKLKPSGVPWLGDVPEHWEVVPARHLFRAVTRRDTRGDEVKLSVTQKHGLVPTEEMEESSNQAVSYDRFQICHSGDLVLNKYKAHLGVFWAAERRGLITPNYTVFRPAQALLTKYFELLFHLPAYRDAFSMTVYGVTEGMSPLYTKDFYQIAVLRPSFAEQEEIVRHVTCQTTTQNAVIERAGREIAVLREYRTRLVADVVTGKLDVREAAANLPEEAEEHEGPETEAPEELEEANEEALGSEDAEGQE